MESTAIGETQRERDLANAHVLSKVADRKITPHLIQQFAGAGPFVSEPAPQCACTHVQQRANVVQPALPALEFGTQQTTDTAPQRIDGWQPCQEFLRVVLQYSHQGGIRMDEGHIEHRRWKDDCILAGAEAKACLK